MRVRDCCVRCRPPESFRVRLSDIDRVWSKNKEDSVRKFVNMQHDQAWSATGMLQPFAFTFHATIYWHTHFAAICGQSKLSGGERKCLEGGPGHYQLPAPCVHESWACRGVRAVRKVAIFFVLAIRQHTQGAGWPQMARQLKLSWKTVMRLFPLNKLG